jgi:hypothetical protein
MTLETLSFIFGALLFLVGLIGGGFEVKELKLPKVGWPIRLISIIVGAFFIAISLLGIIKPKIDVPNVVNLPLEKAQTAVIKSNLKIGNVELIETKTARAGTVLKQIPQAGARASKGEPVDLVVAAEPIDDSVVTRINELNVKIREIDFQMQNLEEELASSPRLPPLHELQDIRREREKRLTEIESLQANLRYEIEQLRPYKNGDPDARHRIEQIEGEAIPDIEAERRAVQTQLQKLQNMIRNAEKRDELRGRINYLKEQKQSLREDIDRLSG